MIIYGGYTRTLMMLAALPVIALMVYVYRQDVREKEPVSLVMKAMLFGMISAFLAMFLESILQVVLTASVPNQSYSYTLILTFFVIGFSEEGVKLLMLYLSTWRQRDFDYHFDGLVYSAAVSLGFALLENILYVLRGGIGVAMLRAVLSVPGHMCFSIPMGVFYANAKSCSLRRQGALSTINMLLALIVPMMLHGLFDGLLMIEANGMFASFVIILYVATFVTIRHHHRTDHPL